MSVEVRQANFPLYVPWAWEWIADLSNTARLSCFSFQIVVNSP